MIVLAFDSSGPAGSAALLDGDVVLAERQLDPARRSAQTLAPAIVELLGEQGVEPRQVGLVATTVGPGSFTGLRVAVTTAKTWAYATGGEVIGLSTLAVIADQARAAKASGGREPAAPAEIHAVLDAQRKELFLGRFRATDGQRLADDALIAADAWLAGLAAGTIVTGSGLVRLADRLPTAVSAAPQALWEPQARAVGRLAWDEYQRGRRDDFWKLAPVYLRPSYAEEKRRA